MSRTASIIAPLGFLVLVLAAWDVTARTNSVSHLILPPPISVVDALVQNAAHLTLHGSITLAVAALGFLVGSLAAIMLAFVFHLSSVARAAIYPYAIAT